MARAAAAAVLMVLALAHIAEAFDDSMLDSVLVIGSEQAGSSSARKLLQQMSGEPEPLMKWLVNKHNELRYRHGVQMLTWDWSLAWNAYNYVVGCPKGHSGQQGIGENLAWGHQDFNHAMRDWYDEIQFYNFQAPGFAENTGHLTQLIWRDSAKIGCAANLRCSFRTWICQFTPAGNLVNYGGSVDFNLWTQQCPAPGAQYITGRKPDGNPMYMTYDPTGESTRGLPQPRYGELKNFGYVPKPGQVVVLTDWQKFVPTDIIQLYLPWATLEQYLKPDILEMLRPEPQAVPKPGQPLHKEPQRAIVGWQQYLPASVIKQYVPEPILAKYVPEGVVLATEKDTAGSQQVPVNASSTPEVTSGSTGSPTVSKPQAAPSALGPSIVAAAPNMEEPSETLLGTENEVFAAPMKEDYESGTRAAPVAKPKAEKGGSIRRDAGDNKQKQGPSRQLKATGGQFFREAPALDEAAQAPYTARKLHSAQPAKGVAAAAAIANKKHAAIKEQGALSRLFSGLGLGDNDSPRRATAPAAAPGEQAAYPAATAVPVQYVPVTQGAAPAAAAPAGYIPVQQQPVYYAPQAAAPQQLQYQQQPGVPVAQAVPAAPAYAPAGYAPAAYAPAGYAPTAAVPLPGSSLPAQGTQPAAAAVDPLTPAPQQPQQQSQQQPQQQQQQQQPQPQQPQLPAGMQDTLDAHNFYRARHQAPPLVWDEQLAATAQRVASRCPNGPSGTAGVGENLAWGFRDGGKAVDEWYKEGQQYDYSSPGFTMTSGHFTQIVWEDTQRVGCALVPTCSMSTMICHYYPPGNVMGSDWASMVKAPPPGAPTGPRPRRSGVPALTQGYLIYQPVGMQQQPIAAVPYPSNPVQHVQVQQLQGQQYAPMYAVPQQQQPVAAVPYPVQPQQKVPAVYSGPKEQQQQQVQPTAAVPRPGGLQAQQQPQQQPQQQQQQQQQQAVAYPPYQIYQPYPTAAVAKPQQAFVPVVGAAGQRSALPMPGHYSSTSAQLEKPDVTATAAAAAADPAAPAGPTVAPAFLAAASHAAQDPSFLTDEAPPTTAATTKPYSAPPFLTSLAAALEKPGAVPAVSSRGRLPQNAPVHISAPTVDTPDQQGPVSAAVDKPPFPSDVPRSHWPHVGQPTSSSGVPFSVSAPMQRGVAAVLSPELQAALDRHNKYRLSHQAPPLIWDDSIASSAQAWASGCPDGHSGIRGLGENMAWGYSSLSDAVDAWYNEVKLYEFFNPGWNTATGHFTALVWRSTTKLGCAINTACSWPTYVCQYGPPGNVLGLDWSAEVLAKVDNPVQPSLPTPQPAPKEPTPQEPVVSSDPTQPADKPAAATPAEPSPAPAAAKPSAPKKPAAMQPARRSVQLTTEQRAALTKHNMYRLRHGVAALSWDAKLAAAAQAWADSCPWCLSDSVYGENIAWGYNSFGDAVEAWYSEVSEYHWSNPRYQPGTGHFSQIVWKSSSKVGCAVSKACEYKTFVCNYNPAGNVDDDDWGSNVPAPTDAVPKPDPVQPVAAVLKPGSSDAALPAVAAVLKPEYTAALDRHNLYRRQHQVGPLVWDDALAASAAKWAAGCPNGHSGYAGVGENMAWSYSSLSDAVDAWYNEVKLYDFSKPGWNTATGHFTALVWRSTTKLGCATNTACGWATYVCQYQTPGNVIGLDWTQQVKPLSTAPTQASPSPSPSPAPKPSTAPASPAPKSPSPAVSPSSQPVVKASPSPVVVVKSSPAPVVMKASRSPAPVVIKTSPRPSPSPAPVVVKTSPRPSPSPAASPAVAEPQTADMRQVLELHNTYRKKHQAAPLVWDEKLTASAKKWASTCTFGLSGTAGVGESLGFGYTTFPAAVTAWYSQVSRYDFNAPEWKSGSSLFTQMVWRHTKAIGCAVNTACTWAMYVCHYSPPGNMVGPSVDWSQQVMPALAAVPKPGSPGADATGADAAPEPADADEVAWDAQGVQPDQDALALTGFDSSSEATVIAAVGSPDSVEPSDPDLLEGLRRTNLYRKKHQVTPLSWNEGLAAQAATFLAGCPLKHSTIRNIGESLGWGFRGFADVVDAWYNEVNSYHFNKPGWSLLAGHFSQMVWKDTTRIGCAVNKQCTWDTFMCQYSPPGNVISADWSTQVLPPLPDTPEEDQQLWNPTLLPGEAYYDPKRPAQASGSDSSTGAGAGAEQQVYAPPTPLDQLGAAAAPSGANSPQQPAEVPVTPSQQEVTPNPPVEVTQTTPVTPDVTQTATPQQLYQVPTFPATPAQPETPADTTPAADRSSSSADAGSSISSVVPGVTAEVQAGFDVTNSYRRQHSSPALVWDASIAAQAAAYVAGCPKGHSGASGVGENLAWGFDSLSAAVEAWYNEVQAYDFSKGGFSGSTGHFTQLVWKNTTKVGCAVNRACEMATYICQYAAPGNVMGMDWSQQFQPRVGSGTAAPQTQSTPTAAPAPPSFTPTPPAQQPGPLAPEPDAPSWPQQQQQQQEMPQQNWWDNAKQQQQQQQQQPQQPQQPQQRPQQNWWDNPKQQQQQQQQQQQSPQQNWWNNNPQQQKQQQTPAQPAAPVKPTPAAPAAPATPATPAIPAAAGAGGAPAAYADVLATTNKYRAKHQVPALVWDAALAARSQAYADSCPGGHSGDKGVGENLAWGYPSWQSAVDAWFNEVTAYSFSNPGWSGSTGHFTQLVWKDTTKVGCGYNARCAMATYVCQYSPAGNVLGNDWSSKVLPAA